MTGPVGTNPTGGRDTYPQNLVAATLVTPGRQWNSEQNLPNLIAPTLRVGGREQGAGSSYDNTPIIFDETQVTSPGNYSEPKPGAACHPLAAGARQPAVAFKPSHFTRGKDGAPADVTPPLSADADKGDQEAVVMAPTATLRGFGHGWQGQHNSTNAVMQGTPRRLTPRECERLQGFPDDWTLIEGASDTPRYRCLGNAVAVPVVEWIIRRIVAATSEAHL